MGHRELMRVPGKWPGGREWVRLRLLCGLSVLDDCWFHFHRRAVRCLRGAPGDGGLTARLLEADLLAFQAAVIYAGQHSVMTAEWESLVERLKDADGGFP
ncbi:hypothetical protein ACWF94_38480 [Streptomyces sp. NPDC055078]